MSFHRCWRGSPLCIQSTEAFYLLRYGAAPCECSHSQAYAFVNGRFVLDKTSLQELHPFGCLPTAKRFLILVLVLEPLLRYFLNMEHSMLLSGHNGDLFHNRIYTTIVYYSAIKQVAHLHRTGGSFGRRLFNNL